MAKTNWIKALAATNTYKFAMLMPSGELAFTKANMTSKGNFRKDSNWDLYLPDEDESIPKKFKVGEVVAL